MTSLGHTPANFQDLTDVRFGRLTVIERTSPIGERVRWLCKCDCGKTKEVSANDLRCGNVKSCGCLGVESRRRRKHDGRGTRLYGVWKAMKQRCHDRNHISYCQYGARGIRVCAEWASSYEKFRDWAIENGYDANAKRGECTIDRIDVNGDYEPANCRWVSAAVQNKNRRPFHYRGGKPKPVIRIDYLGNETRFNSVVEAARELGDVKKQKAIAKCCRGVTHSSYGYRWRYLQQEDADEIDGGPRGDAGFGSSGQR